MPMSASRKRMRNRLEGAGRFAVRAAVALLVAVVVDVTPADADAPTKLWEATGFEAPDSVLYNARSNALFVSNIKGDPMARDGNGYISKLNPDGSFRRRHWVAGLNAPKGMAFFRHFLYVADIDHLVVIDKRKAKIVARHRASASQSLNDVAVDNQGRVYVSDQLGNAIYRLAGGKLSRWVTSKRLTGPTGLKVIGDELWVAGWGRTLGGLPTGMPGHLSTIHIDTKTVRPVGRGNPIGHLDGLEPIGSDRFLVTDWVEGGVLLVNRLGASRVVADLESGSAGLGFIPALGQVVVPMTGRGVLIAYQVE